MSLIEQGSMSFFLKKWHKIVTLKKYSAQIISVDP